MGVDSGGLSSFGLPRAVLDAVRASRGGGERVGLAVCDVEVLAIAQPLPGVSQCELSPQREVGIVALVGTAVEVGHSARGDEQGRAALSRDPSICQAVHAEGTVQIAQLTPGHA